MVTMDQLKVKKIFPSQLDSWEETQPSLWELHFIKLSLGLIRLVRLDHPVPQLKDQAVQVKGIKILLLLEDKQSTGLNTVSLKLEFLSVF